MKIQPVAAELFHAGRRMNGRTDKGTNSCFSQLGRCA